MAKPIENGNGQRKVPSHEVTYCQLRDMILFGQLTPGQPVTIQGLTGSLGSGITPVREAIRKLTSEGALELQGNRRVTVPQLTTSQLDELAFARLTIEPRLAKTACKNLNKDDISELHAIDATVNQAIDGGDIGLYLLSNYRFHFKLYEKANSPILLSLAHSLWLRFGPSLRVVCGRYGTSNLPDRHEEALAAIRNNDGELLAQAIHEDIQQGIEQVRLSLAPSRI